MKPRSPRARFQRHNKQKRGNNLMAQQQPIQQPIMLPPMIFKGGVYFAPQALLVVDARDYEAGQATRLVAAVIGSTEVAFQGRDADDFMAWWDQVTGQARIQPPPAGLKLP